MKFLITSDVHSEKLTPNKWGDYLNYTISTIKKSTAKTFIIAGDLVDSHQLKVDTNDFHFTKIFNLISTISDILKERDGILYILKGTPSHDGNVVKVLTQILNRDNIVYIEDISLVDIEGKHFLFLPEPYYPSEEIFKSKIDEVLLGNKVDVVIFHAMIDFAIPQLINTDSRFMLNRSIVINSKWLRDKFKYLAIGGHVHSHIYQNDIYYTAPPFIPDGSLKDLNRGIKEVELTTSGYDITNNIYYLYPGLEEVTINLVKLSLDEALKIIDNNDINLTKFVFIISSDKSVLDKYSQILHARTIIYKRKKMFKLKHEETGLKINLISDNRDIINVTEELYERKFNKKISSETIKYLKEDTDE